LPFEKKGNQKSMSRGKYWEPEKQEHIYINEQETLINGRTPQKLFADDLESVSLEPQL